MSVSLTTLTGPIFMPDGATPVGGRVSFELSSWDREEGEALFISGPVYSTIDENGEFSVQLFTTTVGENTVNYKMYVIWEDSSFSQSYINNVYISAPTPHYTKKYIGSFALSGSGPFKVSDLNIMSELELNSFDVLLECQAYALAAEASKEEANTTIGVLDVLVADATAQAAISTTQAGISTTQAGNAQASAVEAALYDGPRFITVQQMMLDTALTYTPGTPSTVEAGDSVRVDFGTHAYRVAASGASDHDLTNANGVKLYVQAGPNGFDVKAFGALGDGVTDDYLPCQAAINRAVAIKGKVIFQRANYLIMADTLAVRGPAIVDGMMSNIYQANPLKDIFHFDKGLSGNANFQYVYDVRNFVVRTVVGGANAFVFRNTNDSVFENLYVVGCGDTAFLVEGCLLSKWTHCYVGNGLTASPGFYRSGAVGSQYGFRGTTLNGLSPNTNIFDRCSGTNATVYAFDVLGTGNTIINFDAEGISLPAIAMNVNGLSTNIIGGNFEGTGGTINVNASHCTINGANVLGALNIGSGVTGTNVIGGNVKQFSFEAGSYNNCANGTRISAGGFLVDNGTDNLKINIYNSVTSLEVGMFQSGTFLPDLEFGGASGVTAYFQRKGSWWRNGNIVHFNLWLQLNTLSAATGAATVNMNDIPFTPVGTVDIPCMWSGNGVPVGTGYGDVSPMIDAGTKLILLQKSLATTGVVANLTHADFTSGDQIRVSGFFPMTLNA